MQDFTAVNCQHFVACKDAFEAGSKDKTCKIEWGMHQWDDPDYFYCTECGWPLKEGVNSLWWEYTASGGEKPFDRCPHCGAVVVEQ